MQADRGELAEAVWNVIENALKYAPDAPIHLRAARNNGHSTITVRDEGPGMSESERVHAFERFYRGDQRGEIAGTGLGLAIAKRAVERAGGDIAIDSAPGPGHRGYHHTFRRFTSSPASGSRRPFYSLPYNRA